MPEHSDASVTAKLILRCQTTLQRRGPTQLLQELEQREPDLAEFALEHLSLIHTQLSLLGGSPKQVRRVYRSVQELMLTCVMALQAAHLELWSEQNRGTPLELLEEDRGAAPHPQPKGGDHER